jgi:hypothetical protein
MKLIIIEDVIYRVTDSEYKTLRDKMDQLNNAPETQGEYIKMEKQILSYFDENIPKYKALGRVMFDWRL